MANSRTPGPTGLVVEPVDIDEGTLIRQLSPTPGPIIGSRIVRLAAHDDSATTASSSTLPQLERGMKGSAVKRLQQLLNLKLHPSPDLVVDGIFGLLTYKAVRQYQRLEHIDIDGLVGPITWEHLLPTNTSVTTNAKPDPEKPTPTTNKPSEESPLLGKLVVKVKDENNNPIKDANVTAGSLGSMKTNKDGIADFGEVEVGSYEVEAKKAGHAKQRNDPEGSDVEPGVTIEQSKTKSIELIQHPLCANVSFFEGSTTRSKYYGFDHKTNLVATPGTDEYWLPTPAGGLTLPNDKETRDAGRWVSVAVGSETEVEINFAFKNADCVPCIKNSTFEVVPASIAEVITKQVTAKKATFKIKGLAEGEASLKVICDGNDIGWFHIWAKPEATIKIDVVNLVTNRAPANAYSLASLQSAFEDIYKQLAIKIDMADLGNVDLTSNAALPAIENTGYPTPTTGAFLSKSGSPRPYDSKANVLSTLDTLASAALAARTTAPLPRVGAYRIYRYLPSGGCGIGGTVLNIGASPAFAFIPESASSRNSMAHEFGHCLGLRHPSDGSSSPQFAAHNRSTLNQATPAYPATNTEPASAAAAAKSNIMKNDPTNLMGYWNDKSNRKPLRYHQWVACKRR